MWAVVPVKDLADVKQRLSPVLAVPERQQLFRAMLEDVLAALSGATGLDGVALITRDTGAQELARRYGARIIAEPANRGHTAAVTTAAELLHAEGARAMLQLPGDVPTVTADEISQVVAAHGAAPAMTIVPSRDRQGSNCVVLSPPTAMPLRFGNDSFYPHLDAARRHGLEPKVLSFPGIGLDVDTPDDLLALLRRPSTTRAHSFLDRSGIAERVLGTTTPSPRRAEG